MKEEMASLHSEKLNAEVVRTWKRIVEVMVRNVAVWMAIFGFCSSQVHRGGM